MISKIKWLALTLLLSSFALAQETVIYQFGAAGPNDGAEPNGGLVFDTAGNLYGTTIVGGSANAGTAFELSPLQDGTWQETILYNFCPGGIYNGCPDGRFPENGLVFDAKGNLYGTTTYGGQNNGVGYGTVFELSPPSQPGGSWTEQVSHSFGGVNDGKTPNGDLVIDAAGNLYGTTFSSDTAGVGLVFELSPTQNGWTEAVLHDFCLNYPDCSDGAQPMAGVTLDKIGNLFGTTEFGGQANKLGWGVVYELSPTKNGWTETVLKVLTATTGGRTSAGITFDPAGNLYGGLSQGADNSCGYYFRLKPFVDLPVTGGNGCSPGSDLVYGAGAFFGSTAQGGNSEGVVFKFTEKGNHVTQTILYNFCQQANCADGSMPNGSPTLKDGQLYGATAEGGLSQFGGVIYRIAE
jgi:uncharacterized repeat protein (TIGR03803 family)